MRENAIFDSEMDEWSDAIARSLRAPERLPDDFDRRLMAAVRREARCVAVSPVRKPTRADAPRTWSAARPVRPSPLASLALAAALAGVVFLGASTLRRARTAVAGSIARPATVADERPVRHDTVFVTRFVLIAPQASSVALVGDFNGWDSSATKLQATHGGSWSISVSLPRGRHEYAFVVDGKRWLVDPSAALTRDDEFGVQSSVITVGAST